MTWMTSPSRCTVPLHRDHRRRHDDPALRLEHALPEDDVGDAGLVLDGDEGDVALARPLADEDDAGDARPWRPSLIWRGRRSGRSPRRSSSGRRKASGWARSESWTSDNPRPPRARRSSASAPTSGSRVRARRRRRTAAAAPRRARAPATAPGAGRGRAQAKASASASLSSAADRHAGAAPDILDRVERPLRAGGEDPAAWTLARPFTMRRPRRREQLLPHLAGRGPRAWRLHTPLHHASHVPLPCNGEVPPACNPSGSR